MEPLNDFEEEEMVLCKHDSSNVVNNTEQDDLNTIDETIYINSKDSVFNKNLQMNSYFPRFYKVPLIADSITVHNEYLLARTKNTLRIYKYDSSFTLSLIKCYTRCALVFLERFVSQDSRNLMYKIMIDMAIKNVNINEIENRVSQIMDSLNFDDIAKVKYFRDRILLQYKSFGQKWCDEQLVEMQTTDVIEDVEKDENVISYKIKNGFVNVYFNNMRVVKKRVEGVLASDSTNHKIFLLQEFNLMVISLY